jgi:uracil-DNA glycosylase family 4
MKKEKALAQIALEIENCKICKKNSIGLAVPGEGNANADVVFLGEAPGRKESECGRPFVGPSGKILRALIKEVGLTDENIFITSPVKYLPKYVTPTLADVVHGRTHLIAQLDIIQPKIIVLLGRVAALAMLDRNILIAKEHGKIVEQNGRKYLLAYHPAAQLHNPNIKGELLKDFKKLKKLI